MTIRCRLKRIDGSGNACAFRRYPAPTTTTPIEWIRIVGRTSILRWRSDDVIAREGTSPVHIRAGLAGEPVRLTKLSDWFGTFGRVERR
jgi:hypothetical protein